MRTGKRGIVAIMLVMIGVIMAYLIGVACVQEGQASERYTAGPINVSDDVRRAEDDGDGGDSILDRLTIHPTQHRYDNGDRCYTWRESMWCLSGGEP